MNWLSIGVVKSENAWTSFLVTVDNEVSCHVTLGDFEGWSKGKKSSISVNVQYSMRKQRLLNFPDYAE